MDRRKFLKNTGWSFLGLAASGSLLGSCAAGSKEAKKIMPSASNLKMYWGDLHNHCNITYGHGDMRDASLLMLCGRIFPEQMIPA